jgi:hypothetical protein
MPHRAATAKTPGRHWRLVHREDFEHLELGATPLQLDTTRDADPFGDDGVYFHRAVRGRPFAVPPAYRAHVPFGLDEWLTVESYARGPGAELSARARVVLDPAGGGGHVLRVASPHLTDATLIRPTRPLPENYRVSLRVGYARFGDGLRGPNGYGDDAQARALPWLEDAVATQNGFYSLAIIDTVPIPHNNVWWHHHRKVVIDSDSNVPTWMQMWDGARFVPDGERPIMMFALDATGPDVETSGKPFRSWSAGAWQPSGAIRAVDGYKPERWYRVSIERVHDAFTLSVSGDFRHGGVTTYTSTPLDARGTCVWHENRPGEAAPARCIDESRYPTAGTELWPHGAAYPDYFMFGDPHENFYEGEVYYDDVELEEWVD